MVIACSLNVLCLHCRGRNVTFARCRFLCLCRCRLRSDTALSAVVADASRIVVDHRRVVNVRHIRDVYVIYAAVVIELITAPISALVASAGVAEAIRNAAIEAHGGSPVAFMPDEGVAAPAPVSGCPQ